ncbi:hypothetical protein [Sphingomonas sp. T9W2]|uniref:hypothetical protein n=1 Tax=Sphingomonas sp. T9W2 TaxID=3143183 RepID=UPI0031F562A6
MTTFQERVRPWLLACFGEMIAGDREERNHRFLEEALELVQACGCSASEAHQLVDYVFGREVGDPPQEVGGVMVTLAALCLANDLDMHDSAETELARIWTKVEAIRAKQAAKPKHSPLPIAVPATSQASNPAAWFYAFSEDAEWWHRGAATYSETLDKALPEAEGRPIYIQQAKSLTPRLTDIAGAEEVIERISEDECWGEDGWEGDGSTDGLQRRLDAAVAEWFAEECSLTGASLDFIGDCKVIPAPEGGA